MTQALALQRILARAGHEVAGVIIGRPGDRVVPSFFCEKMDAPVTYIESPRLVLDDKQQGVRPFATVGRSLKRMRSLQASFDVIDRQIQTHRPDIVINFYEPMGGLYYGWNQPAIPMVSIAHHYMFLHPSYRFPQGFPVRRRLMKWYTRLTAWGASRCLALSLYPALDVPEKRLTVLPPLLRDGLFAQPLGQTEPFVLVYILNSGYAEDIIKWHEAHPDTPLHCFWDRPDASPVERYDDTLTFHQIDDEKFLTLMAQCRGIACTAGFESIGEAMYLNKPVLAVPVGGHFEQRCNALDVERAGGGRRSERFDLSRLLDMPPKRAYDVDAFRQWVEGGARRALRAIESAAGLSTNGKPLSSPSSSLRQQPWGPDVRTTLESW